MPHRPTSLFPGLAVVCLKMIDATSVCGHYEHSMADSKNGPTMYVKHLWRRWWDKYVWVCSKCESFLSEQTCQRHMHRRTHWIVSCAGIPDRFDQQWHIYCQLCCLAEKLKSGSSNLTLLQGMWRHTYHRLLLGILTGGEASICGRYSSSLF